MRILQLAPGTGEPSALGGYAAAIRRAAVPGKDLEFETGEGLGLGDLPLRGEGLKRRVREMVGRWQREAELTRFDVVHLEIGGGSYREYYTALELTRVGGGPPRVLTLHDPPFTVGRTHLERWRVPGLPGRVTRRAWELSLGWREERRVLSSAASLITLSSQGARALEGRFPGLRVPVRVIEHLAEPSPDPPAAAAAGEEVALLWLGFWVKGVGVEGLLRALARLERTASGGLPRWRLSVAGGAPALANGRGMDLRPLVRELGIEERVEFLGHVPEAELDRLFGRHQVLIVPREKRGRLRRELRSVSGSMVRAMAQGLAVVATDARAASAEVIPGWTGMLVSAGDIEGMTHTLETVINDRELRARLGRQAQAHIREFHDPTRVIADHQAVYEAVAEERSVAQNAVQARATG